MPCQGRRYPIAAVPDTTPSRDDSATLGFVQELFEEARKEKRRTTARWHQHYKLVRNDTWSELRSNSLPAPAASEIYPTFATLIAYCVPESAEALTEDGWKPWDRVTNSDRLLTYAMEADRFEWQHPRKVNVFYFDGKLQNIRGFRSTEDHRWPMRSPKGFRRFKLGTDLKAQDRLILTAKDHTWPEESVLSPRDAAILGWLVTDGTFGFTSGRWPNGRLFQSSKKFLNEIIALLGDEGGKLMYRENKWGGCHNIAVRAPALRRLMAAGFTGKDSLGSIVTRLSREAAEAMWDAMFQAEGCVTNGLAVFSQKHGAVFDAFQVLSLLLGYRVNRSPNGLGHYVGGLGGDYKHLRYARVNDISLEPYEGIVWCPTVPNGTWVMRQNGKVVITGNCLDQYPQMYVSPDPDLRYFSTAPPPEILAEKAQDMQDILSSWWVTGGNHATASKSMWDTLTFGCGIAETGFDPAAGRGQGSVFWRWVDPYNLLPDPNASSLEDAAYLLKVTPHCPLFEIKVRFPERGGLVGADADHHPSRSGDERPRQRGAGFDVVSQTGAIDRTGTFPGTTGTSTGARWARAGESRQDYTGTTMLIEAWVRDTDRIEVPVIQGGQQKDPIKIDIPIWNYIACAGGVVLTEETANPFEHGDQPFERLPMVQMGGEFWSMSMTEHLRPNAIAINRLLAAMQRHAEICGNPIFLEPLASGISNSKIVNKPGTRLSTEIAATNLIRWLDPPNMSPAVMQLLGWHRDSIDRTSGISAVARGSQLRRREPAAAVDAVQEASFVRIRDLLRNYEEFLRGVANKTVSNITQFYTEARSVAIVGPKGSTKTITLGPRHFWVPQFDPVTGDALDDEPIRFTTHVQAGSSQPLSRQARAAEADMLRQGGGLALPDWLSAHDWDDPAATAERALAEQGVIAQAQQMAELAEQAQP